MVDTIRSLQRIYLIFFSFETSQLGNWFILFDFLPKNYIIYCFSKHTLPYFYSCYQLFVANIVSFVTDPLISACWSWISNNAGVSCWYILELRFWKFTKSAKKKFTRRRTLQEISFHYWSTAVVPTEKKEKSVDFIF